ncbi:ATP-binding protein [Dactylosporangium vinaceum]|uniref:ATP-binding protein n=1 Tax=Dactylosporangium vinaceum TaxID=53362 RepID=UPI001CA8C6E7|nr:ATP-binding protein [Dactylosporangium vinaceum]UAB99561.1 ATP-binding protein [Dactylosporangium vinaceum]
MAAPVVAAPETSGSSAASRGWLTAYLDLPVTLHAPAHARRAVRAVLDGWSLNDQNWLREVLLIVSELATNALRHGSGDIAVELHLRDDVLTIGAYDGSPEVPRPRTPDDTGGWGLAIVESLALAWGVDTHGDGKRVWAQMRRCPDRSLT